MPAVTIDDCITNCAQNIANLSYGAVLSLKTHFQSWTDGLFAEAAGIFKPSHNDTEEGQRRVTNWYGYHLQALGTIEGAGVGQSGVLGTSTCIDAAFRVLNAIKFARSDGVITAAQQTAVIALFNAQWP